MYSRTIDPIHRRRHDVILADTTQQVSGQLIIVSKLRRQNDRYLTEIERGWIDSIITGARVAIGKLDIQDNLTTERDDPRRSRLNNAAFLQQIKSTIQESPVAAKNLTQLLVVAQTLNSATSLLSCCYERHKWTTRQFKAIPLIEEDFDNDLAQLLDRRRHRGRDRVSQLVRIASISLKDSQTSDTMSVNSDERYDSIRSPAESVASSASLDLSEPEGMLSLIIAESIDNWKRNAELALEVATQQSTPSNMSEESLGQTTRSFSQQSRYDYRDTSFPDVKHSIREEPYTDVFQTSSKETHSGSFNQDQKHFPYQLHTRPETFSIRRKPPSRYSSDQVMHKSYQNIGLSPPKPHDHSSSLPGSQDHSSTFPFPAALQPAPETTRLNQLHTRSTSSSLGSVQSSTIYQGMPSSREAAGLIHVLNPTSQSDHGSLSGSNFANVPGASPRSNSSDTIVSMPDAPNVWAQKKVSRGRAWLERQGKDHG